MKNIWITISISVLANASNLVQAQNKPSIPDSSCCCCINTTMSCMSNGKMVVPKDVILDFKTKNISPTTTDFSKLKRGDAIRIKVVNYNPFLYNVVINSTDSTAYATVDDGNFLNWFLAPSNLSSIVGGLLAAPTGAPLASEPAIAKLLDPKNKNVQLADHNKIEPSKATDSTIVSDYLNYQKKRISQNEKKIDEQKDEIDKSLYEWSKILRLKTKINVSCDDFSILGKENISQIETTFLNFKTEIDVMLVDIKQNQEDYLEKTAQQPYADFIKKTSDSIVDSYIKKYYTAAIDYLTKLDSTVSYESLKTLTDQLDNMSNYKTCFSSLPIFLIRDFKQITIQVKPWDDKASIQPYSTSFEVPWTQRQIWGISAGIYGSGLYNDVFTPQQIRNTSGNNNDTTYKLTKDKSSPVEIGINALAYTAWKRNLSNNNYSYTGIAFGAGSSIANKPKPRILLGWLNAWGNTNRTILTIGVITGPVERISNAYTNGSYFSQPSGYMTDVFRVSGFISINYSFLSK